VAKDRRRGFERFPKLPRAKDATDRAAGTLETPHDLEARDPGERRRLVKDWIGLMLYDQSYSEFDDYLTTLS